LHGVNSVHYRTFWPLGCVRTVHCAHARTHCLCIAAMLLWKVKKTRKEVAEGDGTGRENKRQRESVCVCERGRNFGSRQP
jgi:hypothetical protein